MAFDSHSNFALSTVAVAPSPASSGTSLTVSTGDGALFPAAPFNCTVWPSGAAATSANAEIIRVTSKGAGDNWTIQRTQEGTSARTIQVGDQIAATITAKIATDIESAINSVSSSVSSLSSSASAYLTTAMRSDAVTLSNVRISAGALSANRSDLTFSNSNGVSFGLNTNGVVTATVATNYQSQGAYLTTAALSQDSSKYAGTNGAITGGSLTVNTSGVSINLPAYLTTAMASNAVTLSNIKVSAGNSSSNVSAVTFNNANNVSFGYDGTNVTASASYSQPTVTNSSWTVSDANTSLTIGRLAFTNSNGLTLSLSTTTGGSATLIGSYTVPSTAGLLSAINISAGNSSANVAAVTFSNANGISFGYDKTNITASYTVPSQSVQTQNCVDVSLSGNTSGTLTLVSSGTVILAGGNNITLSQNGQSVTISAANSAAQTVQTQNCVDLSIGGNTSGTSTIISSGTAIICGGNSITVSQNGQSLTISAGNYLTTAMASNASTAFAGIGESTSTTTGTNIGLTVDTGGVQIAYPQWLTTAAQSTQTLAFSLGGNSATTNSSQAANGGFILAGGNNITIQQSNNSISISGAAPGGTSFVTGSYWGNLPSLANMVTGNSAITQTSGSSIWVQPFFLPYAISASWIRLLASFNDSAVGTAGTTQANTTFSCGAFTTFGAVIYSQGGGANSRSIQSVASTSGGLTGKTIYSAGATGSQYTITIQKTYPVSGGTSQYTTQYAVTSGSIVVSSNSNTLFTGARFLDIPWAGSLGPGNYWLGIGASVSTASNSSNISFAGTALMPISLAGVSQSNVSVGALGVVTAASDNQLQKGQGVWTTNASNWSTGSIGVNSVSQVASNPVLPFWLMREA